MKNGITHYHHGVIWEEENGVSQGVRVKDTLYISGQFSHDMQGEFIGAGDIERQTQQTLDNLNRYWRDSAPNVRTWRMWRST